MMVSAAAQDAGSDELYLPPLPDEETERRMYARTGEILREAGYMQYEISNYAREGFACRHNVGYWTGVSYVGFGLGAASFLPKDLAGAAPEKREEELWQENMMRMQSYASEAEEQYDAFCPEGGNSMFGSYGMESGEEPCGSFSSGNEADMFRYCDTGNGPAEQPDSYERPDDTRDTEEPLRDMCMVRYTNTERMLVYGNGVFEHTGLQFLKKKDLEAEFMILGLRMTRGVEEEEFQRRFGRSLNGVFGSLIEKYVSRGMMAREDGRVFFTPQGVSVSNYILADFL